MPQANEELADFLRRSRAAVDPSSAPLPTDGRARRVPGLRREEVAYLAGVSTDYYTRLEQGRRITPSAGVVGAIARALDLGPAGRVHLEALLPGSGTRKADAPGREVRSGLRQLVDALGRQPAFVLGRRTEVLVTNRMARALLTDFDRLPDRDRNYTRWILLSEDARALFVDWEVQARAAVENLRLDAAAYSHDDATRQLVEDLSDRSPEFRPWWAEHRVAQRTFGSKRLRHPVVGDLAVEYETLSLPAEPDLRLFVCTAATGSPSWAALEELADSVADGRPRP